MSKTVFILGAGASKEAGAPLMKEFLDKADELRKANKTDNFQEDFNRVSDAISKLQPVHSKAELDLDNIESVFAAFEMARLIKKMPHTNDEAEIIALSYSLKKVILMTLEKMIEYPVHDGRHVRPPVCYQRFIELLQDINRNTGQINTAVITFNYDIALDYAFHANSWPVDYGLDGKFLRHHPLIKLHGSLNWAECPECGEIIPWHIQDFFGKFHFNLFSDTKSVNVNIASKLNASGLEHCGSPVSFIPMIVPPTWNKTAYHKNLSGLHRFLWVDEAG